MVCSVYRVIESRDDMRARPLTLAVVSLSGAYLSSNLIPHTHVLYKTFTHDPSNTLTRVMSEWIDLNFLMLWRTLYLSSAAPLMSSVWLLWLRMTVDHWTIGPDSYYVHIWICLYIVHDLSQLILMNESVYVGLGLLWDQATHPGMNGLAWLPEEFFMLTSSWQMIRIVLRTSAKYVTHISYWILLAAGRL